MKLKIKGIIFDLGGVLIEDNSEAFFANTSKRLGVSLDKIKRLIQKEEILSHLRLGKETSLKFWQRICKKLGIVPPSNKILLQLWKKPYRENAKLNRTTFSLVKRLSKRIPLGIVSNTIEDHTAINRRRNLFKYFDVVILSHEVGFQKPQKEIFRLASKKLGLPSRNLLYITEELSEVKAARKAGFQAIQFKSPKQLEKSLKTLRVL